MMRSRGELRLSFRKCEGHTRLDESYQSGCLRARTHPGGDGANVVLINTGGGLTGGDRLAQRFVWQADASATVAGQAAEKIYRSAGGPVRIDTRLEVAAGADAEWLPQETILFNQAWLDRRMEIELAPGARLLAFEAIIFGRAAMGETVSHGGFTDRWRVRRGGKLIYADAQHLSGPIDALMDRAAVGAGARAMALILCAWDGVGALLEAVRAVLRLAGGRAAASAWNGLLSVRLMARDGQTLKRDAAAVLAVLRGGAPLPRVWTC